MPSIAFATYDQEPGISADDALAAGVLGRAGVAATPAVWDDPGVAWSAFDADQALIDQGLSAVAAVGQSLLYARVDGVARGRQLVLTELEIIEPSLFLSLAPGAGQRFAAAIVRLLRGP